jgi:hypothetical protein
MLQRLPNVLTREAVLRAQLPLHGRWAKDKPEVDRHHHTVHGMRSCPMAVVGHG